MKCLLVVIIISMADLDLSEFSHVCVLSLLRLVDMHCSSEVLRWGVYVRLELHHEPASAK